MEALRRLMAQFRTYWGGLGRARRVALVGITIAIFIALATVGYFSAASQYRTMYTDLSAADAAAMQTALTAQNIPSRLERDGTAIAVPADKFPQAKVAVGAAGLPTTGGKGYELFDESSLTMTPFVQSVNYQRALQAELARSIMQIEAVQSARVLIARPEPTPFVRDQKAPTASVLIKLKPGATLSRSSASSIVSLVSRSVEGLRPENVTVVDSGGRLLSDPHAGDRDDLPGPQLEYRRELESYLAAKAEEMLARHLGAGRAVVKVSADINFQKMKERRETYSPDGRVVAAERLTTSKTAASGTRGVTGAASNVARAGGTTGGGGSAGAGSSEEVVQTDYLVSRTVQDLEDRMGAVTRLTVAVMADLTPEDGGTAISIQDAQEIIKQAVGFRAGRDEIKLTNVRLSVPPMPESDDELAKLQRVQVYVALARNICLALAVVLALAMIPLALLRRRARPQPAPAAAPAAAATAEEARRTQIERLAELIRTDPDRVARVFGMMLAQPRR
jgi:flagellar M-ring protein FliF